VLEGLVESGHRLAHGIGRPARLHQPGPVGAVEHLGHHRHRRPAPHGGFVDGVAPDAGPVGHGHEPVAREVVEQRPALAGVADVTPVDELVEQAGERGVGEGHPVVDQQ
jgi:hypothetical protein